MAVVSCIRNNEIPFTQLEHYFVRNDAGDLPSSPKIDSEEVFKSLFGEAAVMGRDGQPTPVDFGKEFIIAVINPVTDRLTELAPESLREDGGKLVFTYRETVGPSQSWSMRPLLLVKVDRRYDKGEVTLSKVEACPDNPQE